MFFLQEDIYENLNKYVNMEGGGGGGGARGAMRAHGLILMRKYYAIFEKVRGNILPLVKFRFLRNFIRDSDIFFVSYDY